ncbi:hypothetical protein HUN01_31660 [Nostoc edaphicum CCNP1411]|uniref:Uncharacterized protein n=1 Tax=Nostoc edaphicum CCNP1411 TaxID=1472755 RepID=A0A7D7LEY9_9NOSO|nr:hypothetical protein [Nostoc edaphicum]QMS91936.1 hypothetical protein HUN01_31660 [Nostoc edaphicum CCNP1411]
MGNAQEQLPAIAINCFAISKLSSLSNSKYQVRAVFCLQNALHSHNSTSLGGEEGLIWE